MNLSESWKSSWPVGAVFAAPNLLAGAAANPLGPLLFAPSPPCPQTLFSSRYLASLYSRESREDLPYSQQIVLRCREGNLSHVLFFPVGENFEEIGYLGFSLTGSELGIRSDHGEIFRQRDGFCHPGHRITGISAVPLDSPDNCWNSGGGFRINSLALGQILATTLYSVNFFRVDLILNGGKQSERPVLVPIGRRTFTIPVVDACWNPNFPDESMVLLENGDLYWMKSKLGFGVKIEARGGDDGRWVRCEFGGKPWQLFVVSSTGVTMVDLRSRNASRRTKLAGIEDPCAYTAINSFSGDRFIAFSRARDHDFLFSVATEHHIFLYDLRQPLIPVLRWNHGLDSPSFLAMHPLRDLRPSEKFKWSSNSGFAVVSGSFSNSQFSLFCCGPKEVEEKKKKTTTMSTMIPPTMYAWELPSDLCMLDWNFSLADDLVREEFLKEDQELVLGFSILPSDYLSMSAEFPDPGGFSLLRLSSSGRIQLQKYFACWKISKLEDSSRTRDSSSMPENHKDALPTRQDFINLKFLSSYLSGDLSNAVASEIKNEGTPELSLSKLEIELPHSDSLLEDIKDVGIPSSVHEIASRVALFSLDKELLRLAFSRLSDLFPERKNSSFDFPEIRNSISFSLRKPTSKSIRGLLRLNPSKDQVVGPVLPLPLLLVLQRIHEEEEEDKDENLMNAQCGKILETVFPAISLASSQVPQEENPFVVHELGSCIRGKTQGHEELSLPAAKDDKFSVFVCGNHEKPDGSEVFDGLASFKLHFDAPEIQISNSERKILGGLKRQFSTWQSSGFDHDPCYSSKFTREN